MDFTRFRTIGPWPLREMAGGGMLGLFQGQIMQTMEPLRLNPTRMVVFNFAEATPKIPGVPDLSNRTHEL